MEPVAGSILLVLGLIIGMMVLVMFLYISNKDLKEKGKEIESFIEMRNAFIDAEDSLVYLKDENLKYLFVNKAGESYYNKPAEEIVGQDDLYLDDNEFGLVVHQTDKQVIEKNESIAYEVNCKHRIYKVKKFPVKIKDNRIGVGAFIQEITEERKLIKKQEKVLCRNMILVDVLSKGFKNEQNQLDYVLHEALSLTESQFGYIYLYDEQRNEFILNSWSKGVMDGCEILEKQSKYHLDQTGLWGEAVRQRKPIIVNNYEKANLLKKGFPRGHVSLKNFMTIPLIIDGKILVVAGFANKPEDYDDNDVYETTVLMNTVWSNIERRAIQEKLFEERSKYLQTLISIGDGVMVVDPTGKIEMLNKVAQDLTGWSMEEAEGKHYKEVLILSHEDSRMEITDPIEKVMKTDHIQELKNHALLTAKDGTKYHMEDSAAPIKDEKGNTIGVVLVFRDVSEKKEQSKEIEYLSFHDALTGLYNRRFLEEELKRLDVERNLPISIIMGDVNGLKLTNDIFGHAQGDEFLKKIADVMRNVCRGDDIIARWGGDEFVILLPKTSIEQARQIKHRIKTEFARDSVKVIRGNISLGCDVKTSPDQSIMECLEIAEDKMYAAKIMERDDFKSTTLKSIITTLHNNSPREEAHAKRVSHWCEELGKRLAVSDVKVRKLKDAGYFHDIGKIVLENKLLDKSYQLNEEELVETKKHTIMGYRILNAFDDTMSLADAVLYHHERWDGTGYPKGLKGEEIPFSARVIAIADCYDCFLNHPEDEEISKLSRNPILHLEKSEGQFDPEIKKEFIKMMENTAVLEQPNEAMK